MTLRYYPAFISCAEGADFGVVFPDLPGCVTTGATAQEAAAHAAEALSLHIEGMRAAGEVIPEPSSPMPSQARWLHGDVGEAAATGGTILVPVEVPART